MKTNVEMRWLGHSAFYLKSPKGNIIYIDPFLTHNPTTPEEWKTVEKADFILLTHGHEDHVGDTVEIAKKTGATVVSIVELSRFLTKKGVPAGQSVEYNKGGTVDFDDFSVTLVSANHSSSYDGVYMGDPGGLILSFEDDICVYHVGDTNIFADLELYGQLYEPHVALVPIGDHYTMGPEEAAYATEMINPEIAIPIHYGTFPVLKGDPKDFKKFVEDMCETKVKIPKAGEKIF